MPIQYSGKEMVKALALHGPDPLVTIALFVLVVFAAWITPAEADQYIAGAIILAAAPCTAMVYV